MGMEKEMVTYSIHHDYRVRLFQELKLMGHEDARFSVKIFKNAILEELPSDTSVNSAQGIVQKIQISFTINRPGEIDTSSLTAGKRGSAFANDGLVAVGELPKISEQSANFGHFLVPSFVVGLTEKYILADGPNEKPRVLARVRHGKVWVVDDESSTPLHLAKFIFAVLK